MGSDAQDRLLLSMMNNERSTISIVFGSYIMDLVKRCVLILKFKQF